MSQKTLMFLIVLLIVNLFLTAEDFPVPKIEFNPLHYTCYKIDTPLDIDGKLIESEWENTEWTEPFVDIEGNLKPVPYYRTRVKMLWDENYLYIGAELLEPHVWGTLKDRDAVIFYDNDFEVFIDPDGNTHDYYEFEINALGTVWDLFLIKPYRDWHHVAVDSWDIQEIKSAVYIDGTLNDPTDIDNAWFVELAFPWKVLEECAYKSAPPSEGDSWRINFSRVQWQHEIVNENYHKTDNRESNWVWSPQGLINMHYPEMWGFIHFTEFPVSERMVNYDLDEIETAKWNLRQLYYGQKTIFNNTGSYTDNLDDLDPFKATKTDYNWPPQIYVTPTMWEAVLIHKTEEKILHISWDGRTWLENK